MVNQPDKKQKGLSTRQRHALAGSIIKWARIVCEKDTDRGTCNCPCCTLWNETEHPCKGCPIAQHTKLTVCKGTPYTYLEDLDNGEDECGETYRELAKLELMWLSDLYEGKFDDLDSYVSQARNIVREALQDVGAFDKEDVDKAEG